MRMRLFAGALLAAGFLAACGGCGKSNPETPRVAAPPPALPHSETIAFVHWAGKDRLGADTNAAYLMSLWRMPEAEKLQAQTLDKLAQAPWRLSGAKMEDGGKKMEQGGTTNSGPSSILHPPSANSLRPLLDDVLAKESYLEVRQADTNAPVELAFAIRLSPDRAALWQTNLATALESLTGTRPTPTPSGWTLAFSLQPSALSSRLQPLALSSSRTNDWTLVTLTATNRPAFAALLSSIQPSTYPSTPSAGSPWLEAELDFSRLPSPLSLLASSNLSTIHTPLSTNVPRVALRVFGDGRNVHTEAELNFPYPLRLQLDPWNVPTNLVHEPLIGFMAMRGIRPLLASLPFWSDLKLGTSPNQAYFWAQHGLQRFHYMAMPSTEARNQVDNLSRYLIKEVNPILRNADFKMGTFQARSDAPGVTWKGYQLLSPNLAYTNFGNNPFVVGGFSATALTNGPLPAAMLQQLYSGTNLLWYDWELTGECTEGLGQLAQMVRHLFRKARLTYTASLDWLIAAAPKLGPTVTGVTLTGPNRLTVHRSSSMGLTGVEIQVLTDWLESPDFPLGVHSLMAPPQALPAVHLSPQSTNSLRH